MLRRILRNAFNMKMKVRRVGISDSFKKFRSPDNKSISKFLQDNGLSFKMRSTGQIVVEKCPVCPKPHKDQISNMWTLNIKQNSGAYLCFRCGSYGSWTDFVKLLLNNEFSLGEPIVKEKETVSRDDFMDFYSKKLSNFDRIKEETCAEHDCADHEYFHNEGESRENHYNKKILSQLTSEYPNRALSLTTLKKFGVGLGEEMFRNESNNHVLVPCVYFPMIGKELKRKKEDWIVMKTKIKGIGPDYKKYQRIFPSNASFGLFGLNTLLDSADKKICIITEGEYDAMSVYQVTGLPCISLPYGASNLPHNLLHYLEGVERVYLWMDFDDIGQFNVDQFAEKIGLSRTFIVKELEENLLEPFYEKNDLKIKVKDANDALRIDPELIKLYLQNAKAIPQSQIVKFNDIRNKVKDRVFNLDKFKGVPSKFFPWYNKTTKGFRRGE